MSRERRALKRRCHVNRLSNQEYSSFPVTSIDVKKADTGSNDKKVPISIVIKNMWLVLRNKADTHGNMTSGVFAILVSVSFKIIALIGFIIFILGMIATGINIFQMSWHNWLGIIKNIYDIILTIMTLLVVGLYSLLMWGASNEMRRERDKNYIISVFSGVVSFAALIVALVALIKE